MYFCVLIIMLDSLTHAGRATVNSFHVPRFEMFSSGPAQRDGIEELISLVHVWLMQVSV